MRHATFTPTLPSRLPTNRVGPPVAAVLRGLPTHLVLLVSVLCCLAGVAAAETLEQGMEAYEAGDYERAVEIWLPHARRGEAPAQYMLGHLYEQGEGVGPDQEQARRWYRAAADQGVNQARYALGRVYEDAWRKAQLRHLPASSADVQYQQSLYWYGQAAVNGSEAAAGRFRTLKAETGDPRPFWARYEWLSVAALAGFAMVVALGGWGVYRGRQGAGGGSQPDRHARQRFELSHSAALRGGPDDQYLLGTLHAGAEGTPRDYAQAAHWFRKAADQEHPAARRALGELYAQGQGVVRDQTQAFEWFRRAAEQGDAEAEYELASRYLRGEGVPQDYQQVVFWLAKAAEQDHEAAQCELGILFRDGVGAQPGSDGLTFKSGEGVPQNFERALYWLTRAAERGVAEAQLNLGDMFLKGEGLAPDQEVAGRWYARAAQQGNALAAARLRDLEGD